MAKNLLVTDSFIKDKCRRVDLHAPHMWHFDIGRYKLVHDAEQGALYIITPKLGLLVASVSREAMSRHLDSGLLHEGSIRAYLTKSGQENHIWPKRAESARTYLLSAA